MFPADDAGSLAGRFLKGPLPEVIDPAGNATGDAQKQFLGLGLEDVFMQSDLRQTAEAALAAFRELASGERGIIRISDSAQKLFICRAIQKAQLEF